MPIQSPFKVRSVLAGALALGLAAVPANAKSRSSQKAGFIPNPLMDAVVDEPLAGAEGIFDVYKIMVNWLEVVYPAESDAGKAIAAFKKFVTDFEQREDRVGDGNFQGEGENTVEMPMAIDQLVALLRKDAPGVDGRAFGAKAAGNAKAQVFTSMLLPFLQMRGFTYRVRPLVERSFVMHSMAINSLRGLKNQLNHNAGQNAAALFKFVTYPMAQKGRSNIQFHKPSEVQAWLEGHFIPTLDVSIAMAENALNTMGDDQLESLDLTIFLQGDDLFPDASKETSHRTAGKPELQGMLSSLYGARAGARAACTYNLDEFSKATNTFARVHMNNFLREKVPFGKKPRIGTPSYIRYQIYKDHGSLFTLRNPEHGPAILSDLRTSWQHYDDAMTATFAMSYKPERLTNARWAKSGQKDYQTKFAPQMRALLSGPVAIEDYIGGGTVDVDLAGFLSNLPGDLKDFFPTKFSQVEPVREFEFSSGRLAYSNYDFGNPTGWDGGEAAWASIFPNVPDVRGKDGGWVGPMKVYQNIGRTYLGGLFTPIMALVMD